MNLTEFLLASAYVPLEGPDVTWVGPNPFTRGLCLGFDDGTIVFSNAATGERSAHQAVSPAQEAINGVAAIGIAGLAVSTRSDVTFLQMQNHSRAVFPGGAHGVVATESGYFVAPLGAKGLLIVKPDTGLQQMMHVTTGTEGLLYFYRIAALHDTLGKETLVFANRTNGVGVTQFKGDERNRYVHTMRFQGLDVVDVCGVAPGSLSALAISPTAELLWIKDASRREDPSAMRLEGIEGQVYRILATPQHVFVLSSKALYIWVNLVDAVLCKDRPAAKWLPVVLPMEAVDMSLYDDECVLLVMAANAIRTVRISDVVDQSSNGAKTSGLLGASAEMSRKTVVATFVPDWQRQDVQQGMLAATA